MKSFRAVVALTSVAHLLAWAAFLWVAFWPHAYQGVSATPVQVDEQGVPVRSVEPAGAAEVEVVRHSASFIEVNGIWALLPVFVPVILTGLALMVLLTLRAKNLVNTLVLWALTIVMLAFCLLTSLSFGLLYTFSAVALLAAAVVFSYRPPLPRVPQE